VGKGVHFKKMYDLLMDRRDRLHLLPDPAGGHCGETSPGRHGGQVSLFFHLVCHNKKALLFNARKHFTCTFPIPAPFFCSFSCAFSCCILFPVLFLLLFMGRFHLPSCSFPFLVYFPAPFPVLSHQVPFPPFLHDTCRFPNPCSIPVHFIAHLSMSLDILLFLSHSVSCSSCILLLFLFLIPVPGSVPASTLAPVSFVPGLTLWF
jgi:hypothetical protein